MDDYLTNIPYGPYSKLQAFLDGQNRWLDLANAARIDTETVKQWYGTSSPAESVLTHLELREDFRVHQVYALLHKARMYQAMDLIKDFVDPKYHLPVDPPCELEKRLNLLRVDNKDLGVPRVNFDGSLNGNPTKVSLPKKIDIEAPTDDNTHNKNLLKSPSRLPGSSSRGVPTIHCVAESAGAIPQVSYEELQSSTSNWHPSRILGKGGFGIVFKGTWKCTQVAIKRIELKENNPEYEHEQLKQSITELHCLNAYRHDNILPVYAYSIGGPQPCLVYQYMPGGSLERRLHGKKPLPWASRLNIAVGSARGLQFLHTIGEKPLVHGDIKAANILLDMCDQPKIGDFGLAREGPDGPLSYVKVSRLHGTRAYLPDEFLRARRHSTKVDTYSFGIVLFELATGLPVVSQTRPRPLLRDHVMEWPGDPAELRDSRVEGGDGCFRGLLKVGRSCCEKRAKERPEMVGVLVLLEGISITTDG